MSHKAPQLLVQRQETLSVQSRLLTYYEYTKPKIWYLLVFTSLTATFVATRVLSVSLSPLGWLMTGVAIIAGTAGCNALTNYHDRDIDALMTRTRHRPLPSGRITPRAALRFGLGLISISLVLAALLNLFSFLWIPVHIWFLAVSYRSDYSNAGVPMLPVVVGSTTALRLITIFSMIMVPFSLALYFLGPFGQIYGAVALVSGLAILAGSLWVLYKPTETNAWRMFKVTSPYLSLLFAVMIIDAALKH